MNKTKRSNENELKIIKNQVYLKEFGENSQLRK